jgi:hypothetical protein
MDGRLAKFETLVSQSQVSLAIFRTHDGGFTFGNLSNLSESLADLVRAADFVGIIGGDIAGRKPKFVFAVKLTVPEVSAIQAFLHRLYECALIQAASSLTGVREDLLQKLYALPENNSTEEN